MNMPGMAGEAALYRTNNFYRATAAGRLTNSGNLAVIPQDCGVWDAIQCGIYVTATVVGCGALCLACAGTAVACPVCAACVLVGGVDAYLACRDCLPGTITKWVDSALTGNGGGGGGGGPPPCCPASRPFCCGSCVPLPGGGFKM